MAFYEWKHEYHDNRGRFDFGMMSVDYSVGAHWHKAIELMYIVEGDVLVSVDEEKHVMKTGEIVICSSRQIHYFTSLCESSKMSFVIFDEDILDKLDLTGDFSINFLSKSKMLELGMTDEVINELYYCFQKICEEKERRKIYYHRVVEGYLYVLMVNLLRYVNNLPRKGEKRLLNKGMLDILKRAISYIESNYASQVTLDHLAWTLGVSPFYLSRLLRQTTGKSFKAYLNYVRVTQAKILMCNTNNTVLEVAMTTGFNNVRTFNRVFKENTGMTPSEFRRKTNE